MQVGLWIYRVLLHALLPPVGAVLYLRGRLTGKRRPSLRARMARNLPAVPPGGIWIHAVSVGEVEIARRLVARVLAACPGLPVLVTATTATGLELAHRTLDGKVAVAPCPLDLPGPVSRLLDGVRPKVLAVVETELWPEMLYQAARREVRVAVVNGRLSAASAARYRRAAPLLVPLLAPLSAVLARGPADAERFASLGIPTDRIWTAGNLKYDIEPDSTPLPWAAALERLAGGRPVVVAGSTMEGEEEAVLAALEQLGPPAGRPFLVLAPRHPERFDAVCARLEVRGWTVARRSHEQYPAAAGALLLDTIGELGRAYRFATIAFVGGSLVPTGGHNPLEPAVWGVPVLSGPHVANFDEVYRELTATGAVKLVNDTDGLAAAIRGWLADPASRHTAGAAGRTVVERNRGALERTVGALLRLAGG